MGMDMGQLGLRHALARLRGKQLAIARKCRKLEASRDAITAELQLLEREAAKTTCEVTQLAAALSTVFGANPQTVEPRQTFPKRHHSSWGGLTRTILDIFRLANGGPLGATEVAAQVKQLLGVCLEPAVAPGFRRQIGRTLKNMKDAGYLERLHNPKERKEGIWRLKVSISVQ